MKIGKNHKSGPRNSKNTIKWLIRISQRWWKLTLKNRLRCENDTKVNFQKELDWNFRVGGNDWNIHVNWWNVNQEIQWHRQNHANCTIVMTKKYWRKCMSWKLKNGLKLETITRFKLQIHWKSGLKNYEELMEIAKENCKRWNTWLKFQSRKWSDCNMIGNLQISSTKINWMQRLNQISQPDWNVIQNINSKVKVIVMRFLTHQGIDENCGGNKVWNLQVNGWNAKFGRLFLENRFCICKFLW